MASSSSQQQIFEHDLFSERAKSAVSPKSWDVFINHRGPDVKESLALKLYNSLREVGCRAFLDSEKIEPGDFIPFTLRNAISSASVQIAIFSPGYVKSSWCLAELDLMLETEAKFIPVFYQVNPSDLRYIESGVYADAISEYVSKGRYLNYLEKWKKALRTASLVSGLVFSKKQHNPPCEKIVSAVKEEVEKRKYVDRVGSIVPSALKRRLQISFHALNSEEINIFMDIACFFIGKPKTMAIRIWEGSGWRRAEDALQTLQDRCLVEVGNEVEYGHDELVFKMDDLLRAIGREMAEERTSLRRLWSPQYLKSLDSKGFQNILKETNGRCFYTIFDNSMRSGITYFIENSNNCSQRTILLCLELDLKKSQLQNIPSWIPLENLQCLRIVDGRLQRLWQGDLHLSSFSWIPKPILQFFKKIELLLPSNTQVPFQLKELLIDGTVLRDFPNALGMLNNLENLTLKGSYLEMSNSKFMSWKARSLSDSLKKLSNLKSLVLWDFFLSGELTLSNGRDAASFESCTGNCMNCLKTIHIRGVKLTTKISISGEHCPSLESLFLDSMEDLNILDLRRVTRLNSLQLMSCKKLEIVSGNLDREQLGILNIKECPKLKEPYLFHNQAVSRGLLLINVRSYRI